MSQSIEEKILTAIRKKGEGSVFSTTDFTPLASRSAIDIALHRLHKTSVIRRVIRGLYDLPKRSSFLDIDLEPDVDQVAHALARKFGWTIQPSGPAAQNILGLSTQVPGRFVYLSDGPSRTYQIGRTALEFRHTALKETGFKLSESELIVHALKSLGQERITPEIIAKVREFVDPKLRDRILKDTQTVTGWVYAAIRKICDEDADG